MELTKLQQIQAIIDFKTKEAWKKVEDLRLIVREYEEKGDKEKAKEWQDLLETRQSEWYAYNDIQTAVNLILQ